MPYARRRSISTASSALVADSTSKPFSRKKMRCDSRRSASSSIHRTDFGCCAMCSQCSLTEKRRPARSAALRCLRRGPVPSTLSNRLRSFGRLLNSFSARFRSSLRRGADRLPLPRAGGVRWARAARPRPRGRAGVSNGRPALGARARHAASRPRCERRAPRERAGGSRRWRSLRRSARRSRVSRPRARGTTPRSIGEALAAVIARRTTSPRRGQPRGARRRGAAARSLTFAALLPPSANRVTWQP